MHIAICDDDIAHRKHFERLMQRESNARTVTDTPLYIDSYGSKEALFYSPMLYDLFFLVITKKDFSVYELVKELRDISVLKPIVIVKVDGFSYDVETAYTDIHYISDPLQPTDLHDMIQIGYDFSQNIQHLYEIHGIYETRYLTEEEILFADVRSNGKYTLHLVDGTDIECDMPLNDFFHMTANDLAFAYTGKNVILNLRYLEKAKLGKAFMTTGIILPVAFSEKKRLLLQKDSFFEMLSEQSE